MELMRACRNPTTRPTPREGTNKQKKNPVTIEERRRASNNKQQQWTIEQKRVVNELEKTRESRFGRAVSCVEYIMIRLGKRHHRSCPNRLIGDVASKAKLLSTWK